MQRYVLFVHAGPNELARALHALLYAQELQREGIPAKVVFDGAGTVWLREFSNPEHKYHACSDRSWTQAWWTAPARTALGPSTWWRRCRPPACPWWTPRTAIPASPLTSGTAEPPLTL
jgi:hypothetical protein